MIRNLKALGLALVALIAMSAIAASSASAHNITAGNGVYPQHLHGTDVGAEDEFHVGEESIACHDETYTATLAGPSTTIEAIPDFGQTCRTVPQPNWDVTVTENGCNLVFHWKEHIATDHDRVTVTVVCPVGKAIEIHHYRDPGVHKEPKCTNTVGSQTASGTLDATSITKSATEGDVLLEGTVGLVEQTHGACSFGFTINQAAEFTASVTIEATSKARIHIE